MRAKELLADGFQVLTVRVVNMVCAAAVSILVSRALGPDGRGTYVIPGMLAGLVATIFAGLTTTVASSMLKDRLGGGVLRAALTAAVPLVATGAVVIALLTFFGHQLWAAPYAILALPFMAMAAIVNGYSYGVRNVRGATLMALATSIATLVLLASGLFLGGRTPEIAIKMWFAANVLIGTVGISLVLLDARKLSWSGRVAVGPFLTYATRVGATGIVSILNYRIDLYIVAFFTTPSQLGLYATAVSAAETLFVAAQVGSIVTVPHIGALEASEAARFTAKCVRNNLVFVGLCCIFVAIIAPKAVDLLFGEAFMPAVAPLRVLLIGIVPMSAAGIISSYYTLNSKKPHVPLVIAGGSAIICAAVALILVPRFGILGAAIGTSVSYTVMVAVSIVLFSTSTKIPIRQILFIQFADLRGYRALLASLVARPA